MEGNYPSPQEAPQPPAPLYNEFLERGREGKNEWWRYLVGALISFGGAIIISIPFSFLITAAALRNGHSDPMEVQKNISNPEYLGLDRNLLLIYILIGFVGGIAGLFVALRFVHQKTFISVITAGKRIRWSRVAFGAILWMVFASGWFVWSYLKDPANFIFVFETKPFLISALIAILLLPLQTWWEEFVMRGYLLQGMGLVTKSAWIPILTTSIVFGLLHVANPEVTANGFWASMPLYILPGLLFGVIAALDGGLEIPMGLHFGNNLFLTLVYTNSESAIQANTVWRQNTPDAKMDLVSLLILPLTLVIFWLIYKWDVKKLYKKNYA